MGVTAGRSPRAAGDVSTNYDGPVSSAFTWDEVRSLEDIAC